MFVKKLSVETGVSEPVLRLLLTILFAYPISLIYRLTLVRPLKTKWAPFIRNLYVVITGLCLNYFFNGPHIKHSLITTFVTWLFCYFGNIFGNRVLSAIASLLFNMTYLIVGYYMTATGDYDVTWTMPQCVLCLRMIGFAMDFMDGEKLLKSKPPFNAKEKITNTNEKSIDTKKDLQQTDSSISTRPQRQPISFEKNVQIATLPPLIETIGYANFFGAFLIGPQFSFHLYRKFITMSLYPDPINIPRGSYWFSLKSFLLGALYLGVQQVGSGYFPQSYLLTAEYAAKPFIHKLIIMWWTGKFILSKYLGVWTLTEGACILSGISFNGYDDNGNPEWNGLANVEKLYIFKRLIFLGNKQLSSIISLIFLAVWHGLLPGYYICFSLEFVDIEAEKRWAKRFEKYTKPLYLPQNNSNSKIMFGRYLHQFIGWLGQTCGLHYAIISFGLLQWNYIVSAYNSVYWIGHLVVLGLLLLDLILPKPKVKKVAKADKETNGTTKVDKNIDRINGYIRNDAKIER
ncbi:10748_t:CDS:2 [Racocetra persica]|uniref:10748_t:CDS:1 n=1 Tax=Racocetra persica TaxID=160502 RepID=A0ACA9M6Z2_9GLOM|nr:10748_t:CDS:2 [Racocetra persica]